MTIPGTGAASPIRDPMPRTTRWEAFSDAVPFVNFRAGNNSGCLEINQYREIGQRTLIDAAIPGKRELASRCTTNRFAA
jgi:hypothetical protein